MTTFEIVKKLCAEQGIAMTDLEERLNFGKNSMYTWKKSSPSTDKLQKVADYFHVSVDYLLGRTDIKSPLHELEDAQFLDIDGLTPEDIAKVESVIEALKEAQRRIDKFENM
ncbi:helix-turn-helix transcriptional regulator [Listeria rocourtiae]|uniref:helix-turn-helix domain-containing protein n=1 Tax=Listeria rocourtiae TaxID=647910 RepID=UPI003D2F5E4F